MNEAGWANSGYLKNENLQDSFNKSINSNVLMRKAGQDGNIHEANGEPNSVIKDQIKSLAQRQQERIYSAAKSSFRFKSSILLNENNNKMSLLSYFPNETSNTLISKLETQKQQTAKILEKSKEMVSNL